MNITTKALHSNGLRQFGAELLSQAKETAELVRGMDWKEFPHAAISLIAGAALVFVAILIIGGAV